MQSRPTSLTVVCWILIVLSPFGILPFFTGQMHDPNVVELLSKSPIPIPVQYVMAWLGVLIATGSGIMSSIGRIGQDFFIWDGPFLAS